MKIHGGICAVVVLVLLAAGCNDGMARAEGDHKTSDPSTSASSPTEPAVASESPSHAAMTVSAATTCELLFNIDPAPMGQAIKLVKKSTMDDKDLAMAKDLTDSFQHASVSAPAGLKPYIDAVGASTQAIVDMFGSGDSGATRDLQDFQAAGIELVNRCSAFIR